VTVEARRTADGDSSRIGTTAIRFHAPFFLRFARLERWSRFVYKQKTDRSRPASVPRVPQPPTEVPPTNRRPQISREFLEQHRRRRYVDAAAELLHEFGRPGASVTNIVRLAGTARNSFYEVFAGGEDCIAYGIGLAGRTLFAELEAQGGDGQWPTEVLAAVSGFYRAAAADPLLAELFLIHSAASRVEAGRAAAQSGGERFAGLLGRGQGAIEVDDGRSPSPVVDEYFSRVIVALAARRIRGGAVADLPAEAGPTAALAVGFYRGPKEADGIVTAGDVAVTTGS
jgi:AcrR family transcriptional regulator